MTQEERESLAVRLRIELENLERGLTSTLRHKYPRSFLHVIPA